MWFVYILKCKDGSHYTGCTSDVLRRIKEHESKKIYYTKDKLPVTLLTYIAFSDKYRAYEFESYLKTGSGISFRNRHFI